MNGRSLAWSIALTCFLGVAAPARGRQAPPLECSAGKPCSLVLSAPGAVLDAGRYVLDIEVAPGAPLELEVTASIRSEALGYYSFCFSMSVAHDPDVLSLEGFEASEASSFETARSGDGLVGGMECGYFSNVDLYDGEAPLVEVRYALVAPHEMEGKTMVTRVSFRDGLEGTGGPVLNWVSSLEESVTLSSLVDLEVRIHVTGSPRFLRGDSNRDGEVDIADPVAVVHGLFVQEGAILCKDAADSDDSGSLDLTDAVHTLAYLFLGGPPPAAPFPEPGPDPTPDGLDC